MLDLPDAWTWDFWLVQHGGLHHAFFLRASRALLDPDRRHFRASIGHASTSDLVNWQLLPDALVPSDGPAFDDLATWTGCVVARPGGGWRMFYTGVRRSESGQIQRIGAADSDDLIIWRRTGIEIEADPTEYETRSPHDSEQAWRDPWVFPHTDGLWHMLVTACAPDQSRMDRGVIGHATSPDLTAWTVQPPLSPPGAGFGHLEVMQLVEIGGRSRLVFSCLDTDMHERRLARRETGGIWMAEADSPLGPFDLERAIQITGPERYAGRVTHDDLGRKVLLAFRNGSGSRFHGGITDPTVLASTDHPDHR